MTFLDLVNEICYYMEKSHHHSEWNTAYLHWDKQKSGDGNITYRVWYSYPGKKFKIAICNHNMKVWHMDKVPGSIAKDRVLGPCVKFARHHDDIDTSADSKSVTPSSRPKSFSYPITVKGPIKRSWVADFFNTLLAKDFLMNSAKVHNVWYVPQTSVQYGFTDVDEVTHISIIVPAFGNQCNDIKVNCSGKSDAKLDFTDLLFKFTYKHDLTMVGKYHGDNHDVGNGMSFEDLRKKLNDIGYDPMSYAEHMKNGIITEAKFTNNHETIGWTTGITMQGKDHANIQIVYFQDGTNPHEQEAKNLIKKYLGK